MGEDNSFKTVRECVEKFRDRDIESLVCTPDGKYIAIGSSDMTIKMWPMLSFKSFQWFIF